jgi:hypothetical protein
MKRVSTAAALTAVVLAAAFASRGRSATLARSCTPLGPGIARLQSGVELQPFRPGPRWCGQPSRRMEPQARVRRRIDCRTIGASRSSACVSADSVDPPNPRTRPPRAGVRL